MGGGGRISHCFHFEFTLSSHWISQRVHFDFTFDLKGKGKASRAEREKGKGLDDLLGSFPLGNGHRAYARTNETKRFPGKGLPPNLRLEIQNYWDHWSKSCLTHRYALVVRGRHLMAMLGKRLAVRVPESPPHTRVGAHMGPYGPI